MITSNAGTGGYSDHPFVSEFYDHVVPYRHRADLKFFADEAVQCGGEVLEVGCGTGRVLIPTAQAGVQITGLDASDMMLDVCRRKLSTEPEEVSSRVNLVTADMRSFDLGKQFSLITLPFRGFQHLETVEEQHACLNTIHRHLNDGGRIVLDLFNPSLHALTDPARAEESGDEPEFVMPDGRRVVRKHRLVHRDLVNQVNDCELIYYVNHPDGKHERLVHRFIMRYLFRYEAEYLLERCGFRVESIYSDYERNPFGHEYPGELLIVATKV